MSSNTKKNKKKKKIGKKMQKKYTVLITSGSPNLCVDYFEITNDLLIRNTLDETNLMR